jgi:hypothetical protein
VVLRAAWGSGPGQIGRRRNPESVAEGPMSFTVDRRGRVLILDQVNHRVQPFGPDGRPLPPIAVNDDAVEDLVVGKNEKVLVLDRLSQKNVQLYGEDGRPAGEVGLIGREIPEGGVVTGLYTDAEGDIYAERAHRLLVRLADQDGNGSSDRPTLPGRPTRDGRLYLNGAIADRAAGAVVVRAFERDGTLAWEAPLSLGAPVVLIALLDSDAAGSVYFGAIVGRESAAPPYRVVDPELILRALTPDGRERGALVLPWVPAEEESFRELTVGDDGTIYRMRRTAEGVVVERYRI